MLYIKEVISFFQICLVSDPRPSNSYGQTYTVDCLGNMVGGRPVVYNNQPIQTLMDLARLISILLQLFGFMYKYE